MISSKFRKFSCRAYTFVEALVVVAIFTGFVVSTAGVFVMSYRAQAESYHDELAEQSNMRGAFELEHLFRTALGSEPLNAAGNVDLTLTNFNRVRLVVPHWDTGVLEHWIFSFTPSGTDSEGRTRGSFSVRAPGTSEDYVYASDVSLPLGRSSLFILDSLGRLDYHWIVRATDADLSWKGLLVTTQ